MYFLEYIRIPVIRTYAICQQLTHNIILMIGRVFANGPGKWASVTGQVIPKSQKMVLDTSLFNTQHYKEWIKGKKKGVVPFPTPHSSNY